MCRVKNVTLKHADTPQHHSHLSKTTQHHITENGFTAYSIRHKECTLALISVDAYYFCGFVASLASNADT